MLVPFSSVYIEFRFQTFRIRHYFLTTNRTQGTCLNTELVPYSDIHCILKFNFNGGPRFKSRQGHFFSPQRTQIIQASKYCNAAMGASL